MTPFFSFLLWFVINLKLVRQEDPLHFVNWTRPKEMSVSKTWFSYVEKMAAIGLEQNAIELKKTTRRFKIPSNSDYSQFNTILSALKSINLELNPDKCFPQSQDLHQKIMMNIVPFLFFTLPQRTLPVIFGITQNLSECITLNKLREIMIDPATYFLKNKYITQKEFAQFSDEYYETVEETTGILCVTTLVRQIKMIVKHIESSLMYKTCVLRLLNEQEYEKHWHIRDSNITSNFPLYSILVPEVFGLEKIKLSVYTWEFRRHPRFKVKILFHDLKIYEIYGFYPFNVTVIARQDINSFHGILSNYSLYPPGNLFLFRLFVGKVWYFRLNVFFDLMSANITTNYRALQIKPMKQLPHLFYLLPGIFLSVYQIKAQKFQRLLLDINFNTNVQVSFFDGPGYKTPSQLCVSSGALTIQSSTFQCLLHFASFSTSAVSNDKTFHFSFHAIQLRTSKTVHLSNNSHHTVHFASKVSTPVNYVMFLIPFEARTNVSFTN